MFEQRLYPLWTSGIETMYYAYQSPTGFYADPLNNSNQDVSSSQERTVITTEESSFISTQSMQVPPVEVIQPPSVVVPPPVLVPPPQVAPPPPPPQVMPPPIPVVLSPPQPMPPPRMLPPQKSTTTFTIVSSVFPPIEEPIGPLISVYVEDNSHHQKRNRQLGGVGVTAAGVVLTGGLVILPVLAGVAVNQIVKKTKEKCVYAYGNTYIYELRAALANGLGVPPELLQLKRKGVMMEDTVKLEHYLSYPGKARIHITMHVKDSPVVGSVCSIVGQYTYPTALYVDCSSYQFIKWIVC